jgi:hypothetical protein
MISYIEELRRIEGSGSASSAGTLTVALNAYCPDGAADALARIRNVLHRVVSMRATEAEWPDVDEWARELPKWFVDACRPELSQKEALAWLEKWRSLSPAEQAAEEERQPWALADWLHWFARSSDERQWRWLMGDTLGQDRLQITVEVEGFPTAYGALVWLLRAAGAVEVKEV